MTPEIEAVVERATQQSDANAVTFPDVVRQLQAAGVESYHADFRRSERTFYLPDGSSHVVRAHELASLPGDRFDAAGVQAAVRAIQRGKLSYREFCESVAAAGCAGYHVSLAGRRAVYYGRTHDTYVEPFPPG